MNTKLLRQKILDLAIRGKLTDQRKSDGTARELLEQISASRQPERSTKSAKSKDPTPIIPLNKSEAPFEIPDNWEWVKLGDVIELISGQDFPPEKYNDEKKGLPYITGASNFVDGHVLLNRWTEYPSVIAQKNDILLVCKGSGYGNYIYADFVKAHIARQIMAIRIETESLRSYVYHFLGSQYEALKFQGNGLVPGIARNVVLDLQIPLPPLAEQQRIVEKIEEVFAEIDAVEKNKELLKTHIKQTRQKILDLAIHGKLVPQDENDEPASVLLEKILQEKAQSDNKKSPKKNKTTTPATSDNRPYEKVTVDVEPFEIPSLWEWVKLGNVCNPIKRGKSPKYAEKSNVLVFAQKCNQKNGSISLEKALYLDETTLSKYPQDEFLQMGDVVINSTGTGTLGRVGFFNEALPHDIKGIVPDSHVTTIRSSVVNSRYLYYFLKTRQPYLEENGEGSTNQKELKPHTIYDLEFPFPPLAEQKRIVDKVEELFKSLDEILLHLV